MLPTNNPPLILQPLLFVLFLIASPHFSLAQNSKINVIRGRTLMGFKETPNGGNVTFDCSPSGPCIPCFRSEKSDGKYRCGETGYRIRLKCVPVSKDRDTSVTRRSRSALEGSRDIGVNELDGDSPVFSTRQRILLAGSSKSKGGSGAYVSYRSCIPAVNEDVLSVLGFELLMAAGLISSGSFIYFRRRKLSSAKVGGAPVRLPTSNFRF